MTKITIDLDSENTKVILEKNWNKKDITSTLTGIKISKDIFSTPEIILKSFPNTILNATGKEKPLKKDEFDFSKGYAEVEVVLNGKLKLSPHKEEVTHTSLSDKCHVYLP